LHTRIRKLEIAVSEWGATTAVRLEGELDLAEQQDVRDRILEALGRRPAQLILDLSRLSFIDSSGVHVVIESVRSSADYGTRLMIVPGRPRVQRIFEICGLTDRMPFIANS
jgi:anti-sigma B factor antagonist